MALSKPSADSTEARQSARSTATPLRSIRATRRLGVAVVVVLIFGSGLVVGRSTGLASFVSGRMIADIGQAEHAERLSQAADEERGEPPVAVESTVTTTASTTASSPVSSVPATRSTTQPAPDGIAPAPAPPPQPNPDRGGFIETFDGNSGLNSFDAGLWHRDDIVVSKRQWSGDHDDNCGSPATQRTIHRNTDEWRYICKDHMMTAIGDTSGYSIGWFSPKQTFNGQTKISWDVNTTDLKQRQWWEVSLVDADFDSGIAGCEKCMTNHTAAFPAPNFDPDKALIVSAHPGNGNPEINYEPTTGATLCEGLALDPEGCASKPIRRTWTLTDNQNGTVTLTFLDNTYTVRGSFPDGDFNVVFKDHNYTPDKDGQPVGYTWHWDNITIGN